MGIPQSATLETPKLTTLSARDLARFASRRAAAKAAIINLEGATQEATNALLKLLEEPPDFLTVMMTASRRPALTILSRTTVIQLGYLTTQNVRDILIAKFGLKPDTAEQAAKASRGQVRRAQQLTTVDEMKNPVLTVMKACAEKDNSLLQRVSQTWDAKAHQMLLTWLHECITGQRHTYSDPEFFGYTRNSPGILKAYKAASSGCRPKIAIKTVTQELVSARG